LKEEEKKEGGKEGRRKRVKDFNFIVFFKKEV